MTENLADGAGVIALAKELGVRYTLDPTVTPKMDGNTSILALRPPGSELKSVFRNSDLVGDVEEFCAPPPPPGDDVMEGYPCSAGHTACYISPYGDVFPCVQFPLNTGNLRKQKFMDIWRGSPGRCVPFEPKTFRFAQPVLMRAHARAARVWRNRRQYARTFHRRLRKVLPEDGHSVANMLLKAQTANHGAPLIQIRPVPVSA